MHWIIVGLVVAVILFFGGRPKEKGGPLRIKHAFGVLLVISGVAGVIGELPLVSALLLPDVPDRPMNVQTIIVQAIFLVVGVFLVRTPKVVSERERNS